MQQERRSCLGTECGNAGSGLENEDQAAWGEGEGEKKEVRCEILAHQQKSGRPENLHENMGDEVVEDGLGSCESVGRTSRGYCAHKG